MTHLLIIVWIWPFIPIIVGGGISLFFLSASLSALLSGQSPGKATSIAIFGSNGSGKTTLWKQLMGELKDRDYHPTLGSEAIDEFTIVHNGVTKTIKKTYDFSGSDELVKRYNELIEDGSFIYYLIDLNRLQENRKETRSRLQVISKIAKEKKLDGKAGCRLVGTHYLEYSNATGKSRDEARLELRQVIGLDNIKDVDIEDQIMILELTDKNDVNEILNQIIV